MILKNSAILAFFSVVSVLLGIVRDRLLSTHIGVGPVLDIYNAAFRIPDLMYAFFFAFVTAGTVVPFLTVEDKSGNILDPRHKLSSITIFFTGLSAILAIIAVITLPLYAGLVVPGFNDEQRQIFIGVARILMFQPIILGVTSLISCFAQMKNQFVLYSVSPIGYSFGIIFGIIYLYPLYGINGLMYGVLFGAVLSFLIQLWTLRHVKMVEVLPYFSWKHIRELSHLAFPRVGVNVLTQLRNTFFTAFATTLGPGVLTSYLFAQKITDAVQQIIQQSITTASIPVLSREIAEKRIGDYKKVVKKYVLVLGALGVLASGVLYLLQDFVVTLLYGNTQAHSVIIFYLVGFLVALPLQMMIGYFTISLFSAKDTKSVFYSNLISTLVAVFACYATQPLGNISLVYGVIAMAISNFLVISLLYGRKRLV